ncbi:two-component regulator propeller domain-containing protein [Pontibacter sp. SGAir0037]|uniref:hybrid sensor histidine kinase/response regulator transcription factor n=1 Tax=Pontibacter sp. SGAir0037 TaxID=2571030 RepID=UPI0010CD397F|nr:two-component regulator propeller domain-containing protein [Pontibacter sp. SGAir0037]QCR21175.1 hybrid sensor histidine kinase/response regulator [Pontibacter sp. SGAir0037]
MINKLTLIVAFLLFFPLLLIGQPYYFKHYQAEQGLSNNSITSSLQDKEGFLWFGTKDGLNRFDGYNFKAYYYNPKDLNSIGSNHINRLYEDSKGHLWVGTGKGLYRYNSKTESFTLLKPTANNEINDVCQDKEGKFWFIAGMNLYKYDPRSEELQSYSSKENFSATSICITSDGSLWVSSQDGFILKYEQKQDHFIRFDVFSHSKTPPTKWIKRITDTGKNTILIGTTSQGVKLFDVKTSTYKDVLTYDQNKTEIYVRDFMKNSENEYWIATESGLFIYNLESGTATNLQKNYNNPYSLSDNALYTLCKDREGGIWIGTYFGGLNYHPNLPIKFEKKFPINGENSISGNAVREICQDKYGNFWIGTEDSGLNKYNPATGRFEQINSNKISHYNIHGLAVLDDELWIGTFEHGLDVMDVRTGEILNHYEVGANADNLKSNFIVTIAKTRNNDFLLTTTVGLYLFQQKTKTFNLIPGLPIHPFYLSGIEDSKGIIWGGTYNEGLHYYDPTTGKNVSFKHEPGNKNSLSGNNAHDIFEDSRKNLWVTTERGLSRYNPSQKNFTNYTTENGLPSNITYSILEDQEQNLWISTSKGLVFLNPITEEFKTYTTAHGLLSDQFNYSSAYKDAQGRMYFGSVKGMISFNPAEFIKTNYIPPVFITGFQINNKELAIRQNNSPLQESITYTKEITLDHNQSSFSIDFAALSYTVPEMTEYAYKLEGLDKDWNYLTSNRKVYFTQLPPGSYTFMVKAANSSGIWNEKATQLTIKILPPFWASSWAYFIYFTIGGIILYLLIRNYHKQTENKNRRKIEVLENEKEKEIYQAKIEFFTYVTHEIRTPLTLIKGPLESLMRKAVNMPDIASCLVIMEKNTNRLLNLTNQLLDFRKTETNGFSLSFVKTDISALLLELVDNFRPIAEQKNLSYKLNLPDAPLYAFVDREAILKIISNLLSNATKYAEARVQVILHKPSNQSFTIEIWNDGFLIPSESKERIFEPFYRIDENKNARGTGIGLPLARSLAELHNGSLELRPSQNDLNIFTLTLPIHQENEFDLYEESAPGSTHTELIPEHIDSGKFVVLLVEDQVDILEFIKHELSDSYTVLAVTNGKKALEVLKAQTVHLVISDVMMPVMDGYELCRQIKADLDYSHIPVILLTAKNTLKSKIEGLESGADAYIEKPFSTEHLHVQIETLLSNRNKIKEYFSSSPLVHLKSIAYSKADENFLEKLNSIISRNIADTDLNVDQLADIMNMSRPTLYRKIKALSNLSPNELINIARLKKAAELLAEGKYKINEVASIVGYSSHTSFGRSFVKQFGMTPSEYANSKILDPKE